MITVLPSREAAYVSLPRVQRATADGGVAPDRSTSHNVTSRPGLASMYANSRGIDATAIARMLLDGTAADAVAVGTDVGTAVRSWLDVPVVATAVAVRIGGALDVTTTVCALTA